MVVELIETFLVASQKLSLIEIAHYMVGANALASV